MSWSIANLENTAIIPSECAEELYRLHGDMLWDNEDRVTDDGRLIFSPDHNEHMDYLAGYDGIIEILKKHKVRGDICFGSLEGDNKGEFWGYRFDGKGGMKYLKGKLIWEEKKDVLKGKTVVVTGTIPGMTRKEIEDMVRDAGGRISNTVSKNTDLLIVGNNPGSKLQKAKKLGIQTIGWYEFYG